MSCYEKTEKKMTEKASQMASGVIGKKVVSVEMPVGYPGHYTAVRLVFEDGTKLDVSSGGGGCSECDPEGIGWGVEVDFDDSKKG